jgi:hypothetical protein
MKRIFITFLFIFAVTLSANSQVLFTENFAYTAGDTIGAYGWVYNSGVANPLTVTTPGLTYVGYPQSGIGNALTIKPTGNDAYKNWTSADSIGTIYCSFMLRVDTAQTAGDYMFALLPSNSTSLYTCRLTIRNVTATTYDIGLSKGTVASGVGYTSGTYTKGQTILCVVKYKFVAATTTDDEASMYVFTSGFPATEPGTATIPVVTSTANDVSNLGRTAVRQGTAANAPYCIVDGFRVGKTWTDIATGIITTTSTVADKFSLSQNYPNPFNPSTTIKFSLPSNGMISLKVYDLMGKEVSSLVNGNMNAGEFTTQFNGANLSSGMYFYKLEFNGVDGKSFSEQKKLMLVK